MQGAAVVATAGGLSAAFVHLGQAGHQEGARGNQLLESALQHAADLGGVARHTHGWTPGTSGKCLFTPARARKTRGAKKKRMPGEAKHLNCGLTLDLTTAVRVRQIPHSSELEIRLEGCVLISSSKSRRSAQRVNSYVLARGALTHQDRRCLAAVVAAAEDRGTRGLSTHYRCLPLNALSISRSMTLPCSCPKARR